MVGVYYKKLQNKFNFLDIRMNPKIFIYFRLISTIFIFVLLLFTGRYAYLIAPIGAITYYLLVEYILIDIEVKKKNKRLEIQALDFFPIFLLGLKGDRNIKKAIELTTDIVDNELSSEFKKVLQDVDMGKSLEESLRSLDDKIPSIYVSNIIVSILEANRYGNNLNETINVQLDYIRDESRKRVLSNYKSKPFVLAIVSIIFVFIILIIMIFLNYYL